MILQELIEKLQRIAYDADYKHHEPEVVIWDRHTSPTPLLDVAVDIETWDNMKDGEPPVITVVFMTGCTFTT